MLKRFLFLLLPMLLAGCVTKPSQTLNPDYPLSQWQFSGKFAIKTPQKRQGLKIHWQQNGPQFDIKLLTIFGITVLTIEGDEQLVTIEADDGPVQGRSAEQLIWQLTGWHIPVNQLQHWLVGEVRDATQISLTPQGDFKQGTIVDSLNRPWQLSLGQYKMVQGHKLPHQLRLQRDGSLLKLAINQWQLKQ